MISNFFKTPAAWLAALTLLPISACSDLGETGPQDGPGDGSMVAFKISGMPYLNSSEADVDKLSEVNVFHFKGGAFLQRTDIDDPYAESITLPTNGTTRIYCVSGTDMSAGEGTSEAGFAASVVENARGAQSAPMFYSGTADFTDDNIHAGRLEVSMLRSVARIDFSNTIDSKIEVREILVEDAPAATYVFPCGDMPCDATVSYSRTFAEPFTGTETGMFTLFESSRPVHVRIMGDYGDSPLNIRTTLPSVERNKVYTLQLVNTNSTVEGAFTIKDWEEGSSVDARPSTGHDIFIDKVNSIIPEGVTVDYGRNIVTVPFEGVSGMKLAFVASTPVSIASVEGEMPTAKIAANQPVKIEGGYISSFKVDVEANKRLGYSVIVNLKDETGKYNFVEINVLAPTTRTIETVEIGGSTWMAFNCTSPDPDDQIYPVDGLSIEEMYKQNWLGCTGGLFQYGRQYMYIAYKGYNPCNNLGGQNQDMPWVNYSHMPCPEGYHVATLAEFRMLCPNGTTIPGSYVAGNGENITVTLHSNEGTLVTPTNVGGVGRYIKFTSDDTGNYLILPLAGYKGDKSTAASPNFGRDAVYWTNNRDNCWGGYARAYRFMFNWGESCAMEEFQFQMEAFAYVRAIKNKE